MTVGIPRPDRDHSDLGMRSLDPRRARAVRAAVVRDLHDMHVGNRPVAQPIVELVELRVSGEEGVELAVLDENPHRGIVLTTRAWCVVRRAWNVCWWSQNVQSGGAEGDGAVRGVQVLRAARLDGLDSPLVRRRSLWYAIVHVEPDNCGVEHAAHPADVVGVVVTRDDEIDGVDVESAQVGNDSSGTAGIDEEGLGTELNQRRVALADVEKTDFELLGGDRPRRQCDGKGEAQQRDTLHDRSIIRASASSGRVSYGAAFSPRGLERTCRSSRRARL